MNPIDMFTPEELKTLGYLTLFGAAITIQQADKLKSSTQLKLAVELEEIPEDNPIEDPDEIVELAVKFSNYMKEKANAN